MTKIKTVPSSNNTILKKISWGIMAFLAISIFIVASRYLTLNPEVYFDRQKEVYIAHTIGIIMHVVGSMLALIIGPFQFLPKSITKRYVNVHRWSGRIYLLGVLVGGLAGLYMAFMAYGGLPAQLGFFMLAIVWLISGFMAYKHIRNKDIQRHRQWMIRNYALTFAAVTLRLWLIGFEVSGFEFVDAYITVAWFSWVPNLIIAEWMVNR